MRLPRGETKFRRKFFCKPGDMYSPGLQILLSLQATKFVMIARERHPSWVSFTLSSFP